MFNHPPIPKLQLKPCLFRVPVSTTRSKPRRITSLSSWTCSNMRMSLAEAKISKRLWSSLAWPAASRAEQPRAKTGGNSGKMWEKCGNNLKMLGGHDESWWKGQKKNSKSTVRKSVSRLKVLVNLGGMQVHDLGEVQQRKWDLNTNASFSLIIGLVSRASAYPAGSSNPFKASPWWNKHDQELLKTTHTNCHL